VYVVTSAGLRDERGGVLVLVALWLPLVVLAMSFVADAGNWFVHKRHLQLQADAGALAGAGLFNGCFGDTTAANSAIEALARKYAGDPGATQPYNLQIGGANKGTITVRFNHKTYQVGGPPADDTIESPACAAKMVDIKITEAGLPWFFGGKVVNAINARARASLQQKGSAADSLPVGVPDNNPLAAAAIYIDESSANTVLGKQQLTKSPATPVTLNGQSLYQWTSGTALSLNITHPNTGVVIALAGDATYTFPGANLSAICNHVLVECYSITQDATGAVTAATGLDFVHGYPSTPAGTAAAPQVRDVTLFNQGCTNGSGPYFLLNAGCTVGVRAKVDFGTGAANPTVAPTLAQLKVGGWGCPNSGANPKGCVMTYNTTGANAGYFTTNGPNYPTMPADGQAHAIDLNWGTGTGSSSQSGTLVSTQRSLSADVDTSGPVQFVRVDNESGNFGNSVAYGVHTFNTTIGVIPSLQANASSPTAPPVALKVTSKGSNGQAIDCDPSKANLRDELSTGCTPQYTINKGTPCQAASFYNFPQAAPWDCTVTQTGGSVGQVDDGMLCRTQGKCYSPRQCTSPIHWKDSNGDGKITVPEDIAPGDPRLMSVFVTSFGAFSGNGTQVIPITNFGTFYVTGWSRNGGGQGDPCSGQPGLPDPDPVPTKTGGWIVGHFIKYVDNIGGGGTGDPCDFSSFGSCVVVLTK
jgi:Putative Flp pilus-assembly TadE/G-like